MQYTQTAGQNNGRIAQTTDGVSGEQVNYTYDSLLRLTGASTTGPQWGEAYSYDGFGNLTAKTPTLGSAPALSVSYNAATNQPATGGYDANGNAPVPGGVWDAENHLVQQTLDGAALTWVYDPSGQRILQFQQMSGYGQWTFYVYGAGGRLLGQIGCNLYANQTSSTCAAQRSNVYFGGQLIARMESQSGTMVARGVVADRLGTVRAVQTSGGWSTPTYFPYGEPKTGTGIDGREQFATYQRDSTASAQDYAMQRYYTNITGRFYSPDPIGAGAANPRDPNSWNLYAYTRGDPVNRRDPGGTDDDGDTSTSPIACSAYYYYLQSMGLYDGGYDDDIMGNCGQGLSNGRSAEDPCSLSSVNAFLFTSMPALFCPLPVAAAADSPPPTPSCGNQTKQAFVQANFTAAAQTAKQLGIGGAAGDADILALSGVESAWGTFTGGFQGSYFGMMGVVGRKFYAGETACAQIKGQKKFCEMEFSSFAAAAAVFASNEAKAVSGVSDPTSFFTNLYTIGKFGVGTYSTAADYATSMDKSWQWVENCLKTLGLVQ
ncbi:MAG TPA: RHS repeat-associated core domain-containing protein [Bryobacteraceae bacterium]|nr:RHS repeat-associated core domain-containing protein [Bryobacteraceae bacterium]